MSFALTPKKRPYGRSNLEPNGKGKWQKAGGFIPQHQALKISPGSTVFRVLCPASKSGSIIGKGGNIISEIRRETGATVRVEEFLQGCDERVVVIVGSDKEAEVSNVQDKVDNEDNNAVEENEDTKEHDEENEGGESARVENPESETATSSAQKALLLVFERLVEGETDNDGGDEESYKSSFIVFVRLLVLSSQVGCLFGKGGKIIKQMTAESGAEIRVLPRDTHPLCASPFDELVQLTGEVEAVRKALQAVSRKLLENPPRQRDSFPTSKPVGPSTLPFRPHSKPAVYPPNYHFPSKGAPYGPGPHDGADYLSTVRPSIPNFHDIPIPSQVNSSPEILAFRLLCHNDKVGGVIGKGGTIIKTLKHETGCDIKILEGVPDSEDRIIVVSGPAHPDDRISAPQDALLRVQSRIVMAVPDNKEKIVLSRLLVSSNQIGCLLGKGGAVIAEMRKLSGARIHILGKDQLPTCAYENEELVQIMGEFEAVQEALLQITARLRHHLFRDIFPSINHPTHSDHIPPFPSYMGKRDLSPPGMYSNIGSTVHKFDSSGVFPPRGAVHLHDDRSAFAHDIHRPGIPLRGSERAPWGPQGVNDRGGPMGMPDYAGGAPQRRTEGFGSGSQPAIITSTTMEVAVPRSVVPSIYGEDGGCLKQIRQISGAKITITEPRPGATETAIIISGTPEQAHAAQSLLQAFVMSGTGSP